MRRSTGQFIFAVSILAFIVLVGTTLSLAASKSATPKADRVEVRITELHTALNITPAQEGAWNDVARVMRENAQAMDTLMTARNNAKPMNAVEGFNSYGEITQAQADGVKKFIPVFEALYASMSDDQKKNADTVFAHRDHKKSKSRRGK